MSITSSAMAFADGAAAAGGVLGVVAGGLPLGAGDGVEGGAAEADFTRLISLTSPETSFARCLLVFAACWYCANDFMKPVAPAVSPGTTPERLSSIRSMASIMWIPSCN